MEDRKKFSGLLGCGGDFFSLGESSVRRQSFCFLRSLRLVHRLFCMMLSSQLIPSQVSTRLKQRPLVYLLSLEECVR